MLQLALLTQGMLVSSLAHSVVLMWLQLQTIQAAGGTTQ